MNVLDTAAGKGAWGVLGGMHRGMAAGKRCPGFRSQGVEVSQLGWNMCVVLWKVEVKIGRTVSVGERLMVGFEILSESILFCLAYVLKLFLWISSQHLRIRSHIRVLTWNFSLNVLRALDSDCHGYSWPLSCSCRFKPGVCSPVACRLHHAQFMHLHEFPGLCRPSSWGLLQNSEQSNSEVKDGALENSIWWLYAEWIHRERDYR